MVTDNKTMQHSIRNVSDFMDDSNMSNTTQNSLVCKFKYLNALK
jgi:hypothetical protein